MARILVFNGDADGIASAHQLRLSGFAPDRVVTGVKRDIALFERARVAAGDEIKVCDISLATNRRALMAGLLQGVAVEWFDHHEAGEIPADARLTAHINTSAALCTGLIVNAHLRGRYPLWAAVAAFGDNLSDAATALVGETVSASEILNLRALGEAINYNAYGETVDDLHITPEALFAEISACEDPRALVGGARMNLLVEARAADLAQAAEVKPLYVEPGFAIVQLPDAPWARRVVGSFAHTLANMHPTRAHAVLVASNGYLVVSLRAPDAAPQGAHEVAAQFEGGGGRARAAGINHLPSADVPRLIEAMRRRYGAGQN